MSNREWTPDEKMLGHRIEYGSPESIDSRLLQIANQISNLCDDTNGIRITLERIADVLEGKSNEPK